MYFPISVEGSVALMVVDAASASGVVERVTFMRTVGLSFLSAFSLHLTNNTHSAVCISSLRWLYQFNRLLFGVTAAPAIFQSIKDNSISGFECTVAYLDDILFVGRSEEELQSRIEGTGPHTANRRLKNLSLC